MTRGHYHTIRSDLRLAAEKLLAQLGTTPNQVADTLASYGVRGIPSRNTDCALARYLQLFIGMDPHVGQVQVHHRTIRVSLGRWRPSMKLPLPATLRSFVEAFDAGCYPTLVEPRPLPSVQQGSGSPSGDVFPADEAGSTVPPGRVGAGPSTGADSG